MHTWGPGTEFDPDELTRRMSDRHARVTGGAAGRDPVPVAGPAELLEVAVAAGLTIDFFMMRSDGEVLASTLPGPQRPWWLDAALIAAADYTWVVTPLPEGPRNFIELT